MTFPTLLSFDVDHDRIDELFTALDLGFSLSGVVPIADFPDGPPLPHVDGGRRTYEFDRTHGSHWFTAVVGLLRYDEHDVFLEFDCGHDREVELALTDTSARVAGRLLRSARGDRRAAPSTA